MNHTWLAWRPYNREAMAFALWFVAIAGALLALYAFPYQSGGLTERAFDRYLALYARAAGALLRVFEPNIIVSNTDIIGRFSMRIVKNCDAIEINILFSAAVLAFPARWRKRLIGLTLGLPLLVLLNLGRICSLYYVGVHAPGRFELFHLEVWPLVLVVATVLLFVGFVSWSETTVRPS